MKTKLQIAKTATVVLVGTASIIGAAYGLLVLLDSKPIPQVSVGIEGMSMSTPFYWPGIEHPTVVARDKAILNDNEPVIGIVVNGKARAYRVKALHGMTNHVVNDLVDGKPVSVTYCDLKKCSRVFTGPGEAPLGIATGAFLNGLVLSVNGQRFSQETGLSIGDSDGKFPFAPVQFEETTWKSWCAAHPITDIYVEAPMSGATGKPLNAYPKNN